MKVGRRPVLSKVSAWDRLIDRQDVIGRQQVSERDLYWLPSLSY